MNHKQTRRARLAHRRELQRRQREALPTIVLTAFAVGLFAGYGWAAQAYGQHITSPASDRQVVNREQL
ncbi:hypothetical protein [Synechococcus elongatus]|uniref:hypothetical protein n=1 Tax=Synechococcus elongatus TaxID=32046 RepID=UPI000039FF04|nr:hypothetical protein [Synechococcus elongatus]MBD2588614.1 hypothetical protein [Synechococcus elongatus FACHB-242]MBD2689797.1 hypothetical protein [Synechococcus elongatus FACHB-1061]MBD2708404.1 hypothetical protein [Synechococcus elongatus PCC 7942 = FACHB-805]WKW06299.1 hypothetical protein QY054_03760 [Synechococcus elongatus PCC 7942 = FACHB-805]